MANKKIFKSAGATKNVPVADTVNRAGGKAYKMSDRHALAQIAATNTFNGTYYASAEDNLALAKSAVLALRNDPEFVAKVAVYSRDRSFMKDMPAFLTVALADYDKALFRKVFRKVVDNGKMLRNVVQMARSGAVTGKVYNLSAGTFRHAIQEWFDSKSPYALFKASIGNDPTMRDILRMARPKPNTPEKEALYGYFLGKDVAMDRLPEIVRNYELYKKDKSVPLPDVDFRMLDSLGIGDAEWTQIARNAPWMMTRMNLNTFARHNVFKDAEVTKIVAERLSSKEEIAKARAFPYQLFSAWRAIETNNGVPYNVREALQDAAETAIENVPALNGKVLVAVDCSGSMGSPVTGYSATKSTSVSCSDVAGLIASAIYRKNRDAEIWTFSDSAKQVHLNPRDTVLTNTTKLNRAGGGTNISAPICHWNKAGAKADTIVYISDMESWVDSGYGYSSFYGGGTGLLTEWEKFSKRNPNAKLICIDLQARNNSQVKERPNILQVGGWSDDAFRVMASFQEYGHNVDHWVAEIDAVSLD